MRFYWCNGYTLDKLKNAIKNDFNSITETIDICCIEDKENGTSVYLARYNDGLDLTFSIHNKNDFYNDFENTDFIGVDINIIAEDSEEEFIDYIMNLYNNLKIYNKEV